MFAFAPSDVSNNRLSEDALVFVLTRLYNSGVSNFPRKILSFSRKIRWIRLKKVSKQVRKKDSKHKFNVFIALYNTCSLLLTTTCWLFFLCLKRAFYFRDKNIAEFRFSQSRREEVGFKAIMLHSCVLVPQFCAQ